VTFCFRAITLRVLKLLLKTTVTVKTNKNKKINKGKRMLGRHTSWWSRVVLHFLVARFAHTINGWVMPSY